MRKHLIILLALCALLPLTTAAQNGVINVRARQSAPAGQTFQITFEVDGEPSNFKMPSLKNLTHVGGPNVGYSSYSTTVNGKFTHTESYTITILVQGDKEGTANVGSASCSVGGKTVSSKPFSVKIEKANPNRRQQQQQQQSNWGWGGWGQPQPQQQQRQQQQQRPATAQSIDKNTLFARASINKTNLYQGEEAIIVYKIYTQVPLTQFQIEKLPRNKGFWSEDLSEGQTEVKQYAETVNGRQYQVAEIRRGALFPQETGTLNIAPLQTDVVAIIMTQMQRQRTGTILDFFIDDPFFTPTQQQAVVKSLTSNSINVNVKPLPEAPEGFAGGVGHFDIKVKSDLKQLRAGESMTYSVTVSGRGNLSLLETPQVAFPQGLDVYEPRVVDNIVKGDGGLSGSRTFEWIVTPQTQGNYEIPALNYVYFDPSSGQYVTLHGDAVKLKVAKGDNSHQKSDVAELNSDIHHIEKHSHFSPLGSNAHAGFWFWLLMLVPLVAAIVVVAWVRRQQAIAGDEGSMRLQRATKLARKRLRNAERHLHDGNDERFYEEIYKALWGGISDKFNIQLSLLSSDTIRRHMADKQVDEGLQQRILQTLADVDFARFAPGDSSAKKQSIYDEAMETIMQISAIKMKQPNRASAKETLAVIVLLMLGATSSLQAATTGNADCNQLFAQGNAAYDSGDYHQAIEHYAAILDAGQESWQLYYNMGNAYYRLDELGQSILHYERALLLSPHNKAVKDNLLLAQSKTADHIEQLPRNIVAQWFDNLLHITSPRGWRTVCIILMVLLCAAATLFFVANSYKLRKTMFVVGSLLLVLTLFSIVDATISARNVTHNHQAVVTAPMVVVKGAPDPSAVEKFVLHEGTELQIKETDENWWLITIADGKEGWIDAGAEKIVNPKS